MYVLETCRYHGKADASIRELYKLFYVHGLLETPGFPVLASLVLPPRMALEAASINRRGLQLSRWTSRDRLGSEEKGEEAQTSYYGTSTNFPRACSCVFRREKADFYDRSLRRNICRFDFRCYDRSLMRP